MNRIFKPGAGTRPPYLAGRDDELKLLGGLADELREGKPPSNNIIMLGPRGNGKTVLMHTFIDAVQKENQSVAEYRGTSAWEAKNPVDQSPKSIRVVKLAAVSAKNIRGLLAACQRPGSSFNIEEVGIPGVVKLTSGATRDIGSLLRDVLMEQTKFEPMILAIDEAHRLDPDVGELLFNVVQDAQSLHLAPLLLIVAGTPGLEAHVRKKMQTTFMERAQKVRVGLLDVPGAREALAKPFANIGVRFDDDALSEVVGKSLGYPYFLQLLGDALQESLDGADRIEMTHVGKALKMAGGKQEDFCHGRYEEFLDDDRLLNAAEAIARVFPGNGRMSYHSMRDAMAPAVPNGDDARYALNQLVEIGYVWKNERGDYLAGVPSLMDHVLKSAKAPEHDRGLAETSRRFS